MHALSKAWTIGFHDHLKTSGIKVLLYIFSCRYRVLVTGHHETQLLYRFTTITFHILWKVLQLVFGSR